MKFDLKAKLGAFLRRITFASLRDSHNRARSCEFKLGRTQAKLEHTQAKLERVEGERDRAERGKEEWRERDAIDERCSHEACERGAESPERSPVADSMSDLQFGQILTGRVTQITSHEVEVDIDGVECPLHIPESSWEDIEDPSELLRLGGRAYAKVLSTPDAALHPFLVLISPRQARRELGA